MVEKFEPIPEFDQLETVIDPGSITLYVDGYWGVIVKEHSVRLNLFQEKHDGMGSVKKHIIATIVMDRSAFIGVANGLAKLRDTLSSVNMGGEGDDS